MMVYNVEINTCSCHPETCCCRRYKIVDNNGNTYTTIEEKHKAEQIANALNNHD